MSVGGILPLPARGDVADVISGPGGEVIHPRDARRRQHERGIAEWGSPTPPALHLPIGT